MCIITRMRILVAGVLILVVGAYAVYCSGWFQKKYVYPLPYEAIIFKYALENDLDPFLVASVIRAESKFLVKARSPKGAMGLMQMMPETAEWVATQLEFTDFSIKQLDDPEVSIRLGAWYLSSLKKEFNSNEILMLAAYNGGRGNVKHWMEQYQWSFDFAGIEGIPFRETREYVKKVLASKARYQELYQAE
ncbi:putative membrane protein [Propionispora sp. 2/2-37]|nr:putative membrane protein [Propionispora sp. 2/2-37]